METRFLHSRVNAEDIKSGELAQLARASALHAEGHRFDSDNLHYFEIEKGSFNEKIHKFEEVSSFIQDLR